MNNINVNIRIWISLGILLTTLTYLPVLNAEFTNWDDNIYIIDNQLIHAFTFQQFIKWFSFPFLGLYQPLVLLSLGMDYSINGLDPFVFHLTNLLLHLVNTYLIFLFVRKLTGHQLIALFAFFLFGLHPIHVESVAWVTERKDVLYSFFYLSALVLYTNYLKNKNKKLLILVFIVFVFALLSKASAVSLPLVLILIDYYYLRRLTDHKLILEKIPFFILAIGFGLLTLYLHRDFGSLVNASGLALPARILLASKGLIYHLSKFFWPMALSTLNPLPASFSFEIFIECIFYLIVIILFGYFIYRKKDRNIVFGTAFYLLTIGLFLVPPGVPVIASERYSYIPIMGLLIAGSHLIVLFIENNKKFKLIVLIFFASLLVFYSITTYQQAKTWHSSLSLWNHVIKVRGESYLPLLKRGTANRLAIDYDAALIDYNRSIELNPNYYISYDNRGYLYLLKGQYENAIADFKHSAEMYPKNTFALSSLGFIFRKMNQPDSAMHYLNKALHIDPSLPEVYFNRGKIYLAEGSMSDACSNLKKALKLGLSGENKTESLDLIREHCR